MAQDAVLIAVKKENNLYYVKDQYQINNLGNLVNLRNFQVSQEKSSDKGLSSDNKLSSDNGGSEDISGYCYKLAFVGVIF